MEEGCASGSGGGGGGESARVSTSYMAAGGRQRFEVELRPGETTIVSWKKLVKDANRAVKDANKAAKGKATAMEVPSVPQSAMESRVAPGEPPENEANDAPPASRFSAVIEKIERLYMGKNSSDEEDLNDVPDDDEYDTEDSFIDDAELDEYFQVDNSAIKHDGFFVNRGTLERTNEPSISPHQQPKKRRRKDLAKGQVGSDEGNAPNKHVKVGKKAAGRSLPLAEKNSTNPTLVMALPTVNFEDLKYQNQTSSSGISAKNKSAEFKSAMHQSPVIVSNGEAITEEKGEKQKLGVLPSKNHGSKLKDGYEFSDTSNHRLNEKISHAQCKSQSSRSLNSGEDLGQSVQLREKNGIRERSDITVSEGRNSMQTMKVPHMQRKEGSSVKSRSSMLEKAIRELEKMVAESRPPSMEMLDADMSSQVIKRRMPPEIKLKLAKVARLAATHGKISKELLNRLMSIVGHLIQLRTLKRNLKNMVNMGLSAKQETDARFQQIKKEIDEMVKFSVSQLKSKAPEEASGASDDFQHFFWWQLVAIKQLDHNGAQGIREFIVEVMTLGSVDHPNLVKLIGFCAEGVQRLLVYEYMPLGSLEDCLHGPNRKRLDWNTRMKIAAGAARGLEYLHDKMHPPVIYRDLKCSNLLLGEDYHPKLSDFGLAKVGPTGDNTHVSTRVMGTYGYCAPDYAMTGQLTFKSDVYSFGVVLLEIITGRKAIDNTKCAKEQNLVAWARPLFKDRKNFSQMVDPVLQGQYPVRGLYQALAIAAMCVQEQPSMRPLVADLVTALTYLASQTYDPQTDPVQHSRKCPSSSHRH